MKTVVTVFTLTPVDLSPLLPHTILVKMKTKIHDFRLNQTIPILCQLRCEVALMIWEGSPGLAGKRRWQGVVGGGDRNRQCIGSFAVSEAVTDFFQ